MLYTGQKKLQPTKKEFISGCTQASYQHLQVPLKKEEGCIFVKTGMEAALLNGVIECSIPDTQVDTIVKRVTGYFKEKKLPHSWWVDVEKEPKHLRAALEKRGLHLLGEFPAVVIETQQVKPFQISKEICIKQVSSEEDFLQWGEVITSAFHFPESVSTPYTAVFQKAGLNGPFFHFIAKKDGIVVSTGTLLFTNAGAYIYNIATIEKERNRGYASTLLYSLIEFAKLKSCAYIGLISSPIGIPLYERLGFEKVTLYHIYA
ncbi:MAG: putative acetyltransferase [Chlamydiia bacterium]|nr:putative acetyltransferase [Chlamydiia bacterium]